MAVPFLPKKKSQLLKKVGSKPAFYVPKAENFENVVVLENERGTVLFQVPKFSKKSLLPTDNPPFCDVKGNRVLDIKHYQCLVGWEWISEWIVDKNNADEQGWSYNTSFLDADNWKPVTPSAVSVVRQRKWIRMRKLVDSQCDPKENEVKTDSDSILKTIQLKRNDLEKVVLLQEYLLNNAVPDAAFFGPILEEFDFQSTKLEACLLIAHTANEHLYLAETCLKSLEFLSDKIKFLEHSNIPQEQHQNLLYQF
jgi:hypothetical protein